MASSYAFLSRRLKAISQQTSTTAGDLDAALKSCVRTVGSNQTITGGIIVDKITAQQEYTSQTVTTADNSFVISKGNAQLPDTQASSFLIERKGPSGGVVYDGLARNPTDGKMYIISGAASTPESGSDVTAATPGSLVCQNINATSVVDSTSIGTGAIVAQGGLSVAKGLTVGGSLKLGSSSSQIVPANSNGMIYCSDGLGNMQFMPGASNLASWTIKDSKGNPLFSVSNTTASPLGQVRSYSSLMTLGTLGVGSSDESTGVGTGALMVNGGASVYKSLTIGGTINSISVPSKTGTQTFACLSDIPSVPANICTTDTTQTITGPKTFGSPVLATRGVILPTSGSTATSLSYYEEAGQFMATLSAAFLRTPTSSGTYFTRIGNIVCLRLGTLFKSPDIDNAPDYLYLDGIPARLVPRSWSVFMIAVYEKGVLQLGQFRLDPNMPHIGTISLYNPTTGTFGKFSGTTGSKFAVGTEETYITYTLI